MTPCTCDRHPRVDIRTIPDFENPVTQRPGAADFTPNQKIEVKDTIYAVSIAPDSEVDVCDLFLGDSADTTRIRVSVDAPFVGILSPAMFASTVLSVVPVRPARPVDNCLVYGPHALGSRPVLRLQLWKDAPPRWLPTRRAPAVGYWTGTITGAVSFLIPVLGRRDCIAWQFVTDTYVGAANVTPRLTLYTHSITDAGVIDSVPFEQTAPAPGSGIVSHEFVAPGGAVNGSTRNDYGCQATMAVLTLTPNAGSFSYRVTGHAE